MLCVAFVKAVDLPLLLNLYVPVHQNKLPNSLEEKRDRENCIVFLWDSLVTFKWFYVPNLVIFCTILFQTLSILQNYSYNFVNVFISV